MISAPRLLNSSGLKFFTAPFVAIGKKNGVFTVPLFVSNFPTRLLLSLCKISNIQARYVLCALLRHLPLITHANIFRQV